MSDSPHLGIGYLAPSQAQKHVTVNEAFRRLDALVQLGVVDRTLTAPPVAPAEGERHIVADGATGAWAGQARKIAAFLDGVWVFVAPKPGWLAYAAAEGDLLAFVGGAWTSALGSIASLDTLTRLGVNATSDAVNRLAVSSSAALFNHAGAGVQVKLNKAAAADTASLLFQRGFSGRAEFGLTGSDSVSLKVSPDGAAWTTALVVDAATGMLEAPATPRVLVEKFTVSGTWTRPAWAKRVRVHLISGGCGGGSGALRGTGVAASGGGGGGPGVSVEVELQAADLPETVAITIGAGGAGGAAQTVADANGVAGGVGGHTSFGAILRAISTSAGGTGGSTATAAGGSVSGARFTPPQPDVSGGSGTIGVGGVGGAGYGLHGAGGGGGGGLSTLNAEANGGASGASSLGSGYSVAVAGGVAPGGAGGAGAVSALIDHRLATGGAGSGGASGAAANGGAGGDGAIPGGAGGGGGASRNGRASGKGGAGARGEAWIISLR